MESIRKNLRMIIFLLILLVLTTILLFIIKQKKPADEVISLRAAVAELDYSRKLLEYPFPEKRAETTSEKVERAYDAWVVFVKVTGNIRPPEFARTYDWQKKIMDMREYPRKANEFRLEKNEKAAVAEMEKAFALYAQIKKENNIGDMFNEISEFYRMARKVGEAESKTEALTGLTDLKLIFTGLKEQVVDDQFRRLTAKLELAIMDIERLLPGPDFKKAQNDLLIGAEELYWQY